MHDPGQNARRTLAFNGHIDVVSPEPVSLWSSPPFEPRIVTAEDDGEDWMVGRGAGDMKGGTVCYLWALAALRDMGLEPASKVILQSPVEEECTGNGALAILDRGWVADACIIPEPFNETLLARQVGVMWFQVRILGRTTHVLGAGRGGERHREVLAHHPGDARAGGRPESPRRHPRGGTAALTTR